MNESRESRVESREPEVGSSERSGTGVDRELRLVVTDDGSTTLYVPSLNEHYHSTFGAIAESAHVFVGAGFDFATGVFSAIRLLEVGFGTGLNALLTFIRAEEKHIPLHYTGLEPFPVSNDLLEQVSPVTLMKSKAAELWWNRLHNVSAWDRRQDFSDELSLLKRATTFESLGVGDERFNLVYFDAFAPGVQPELWEEHVFRSLARMMEKDGVFVTYSSRGSVRRGLIASGFHAEKIPGPAGKREMVRAYKK